MADKRKCWACNKDTDRTITVANRAGMPVEICYSCSVKLAKKGEK